MRFTTEGLNPQAEGISKNKGIIILRAKATQLRVLFRGRGKPRELFLEKNRKWNTIIAMKISEVLERILTSHNVASRQPIFEKYDKNVQGNTVHERGQVAASVVAPFRDFPELSESKAQISVAIATGGNPNLAKVSARIAARSALMEATLKTACVGGEPIGATDCLNFGNPEKKDQMGEFVEGVEGLADACRELSIPIVSGNVSLYNESSGKSIPPSALVSVFARVQNPAKVPQLAFQKSGESIYYVGARSEHLGGSSFLQVCEKSDTRIPEPDVETFTLLAGNLRKVAQEGVISTAQPILNGGILTALALSSFGKEIGAEINIPSEFASKVPQFLFSEDLGVVMTTSHPEQIASVFGDSAVLIGKTTDHFGLKVNSGEETLLDQDMGDSKKAWEDVLRKVF